jgi:hypothetical protein
MIIPNNISTPMITSSSHETEICPNCKKIENKIEVCGHCGYKYPLNKDFSFLIISIIFLILLFIIYIAITCAMWFEDSYSLFEILQYQWNWIKTLKIW